MKKQFAALSLALAISPFAHGAEFINVLTGGTSGVYYPVGVAMSQLFTKAMPAAKVSVQATKASAENLNLLQAGRGELGFTLADAAADAWKGEAEAGFAQPLKKLRAVAAIYPNYIQIVASSESGIKTLADLKGKRISVGAPKSGTELNARAILKAAGLSYKDFAKVEFLSFGESVELMKNRQLDATLQSSGLGVASIRDLSSALKVTFVPVTPDIVARIGDPAYQATKIPAKTYDDLPADLPTVAISNLLVTNDKVPNDTVYMMTKQLFTNLPVLANAHAAIKAFNPANALKGLPMPLHPGAEKYYREIGLLK